jgi:23S rRNA pseudouridine2605 synthase
MELERLQKIIANAGYCSRRKAEKLIEQGKVKLNGELAKLGDKATSEDKIVVEGEQILSKDENHYYILNKPKGILVTKSDPKGRRIIYNLKAMSKLKKEIGYDLNYVGRLDGVSEGLLILTNDGELTNRLTHPKHHVSKTYEVRTEPKLSKEDVVKLEKGFLIEGRKFFAKISGVKSNTFEISIQEGRNRIIRRVLEKLNYKIFLLKRISVGNVKLGDLKSGEVRKLSGGEVCELKENIVA